MANNVVEYFIRAKDETGAAVSSALSKIKSMKLDLNSVLSSVRGGINGSVNAFSGFSKSISDSFSGSGAKIKSFSVGVFHNLMNIKSGFEMLAGVVKTVSGALYGAIKEAFKFEAYTVQFSVLMKSMTLAKERMAELYEFAAKTPFELDEVVRASKMLHVFSNGAMGATESLRLVGDAASAIGVRIEDLSFWVGRTYTLIRGGQPFGEAALRLQEMGILTSEARQQMEKLQASGASNIEVWGVLEKRLKEFEGGMNTLSKTGEGLTSTLKDTWTESVREFGSAFSDSAKTGISTMIKALDDLNKSGAIKTFGANTASVLNNIISLAQKYAGIFSKEIGGKSVGRLVASATFGSTATAIGASLFGANGDNESVNSEERMFSDMLVDEQKQAKASQDKIAEDMAKAQKTPEKTKEQIEYDKQLEEFKIKLALEAEQEIYDNAIDSAKKTSEEVQKILEDQQKKKDEFAKKEQERYEKIAEDANEAFRKAAEEQLAIAQKQGDAEIAIAQAIANAKDRMAQNAKKGRIGDNIDAIQQERQKRIDDSKDNDRTEKRAKSLRSLKSLSKEQAGWLAEFDRQQALRNMGAPGGKEQDQIKAIQEGLITQKKMLEQLEQINKQTAESLRVN